MTNMHLNWLTWPVERASHAFRAYVVEPSSYDLPTHEALFSAVLKFFEPTVDYFSNDARGVIPFPVTPPSFDLLTFPEAFLPASALVSILRSLGGSRVPTGCIHVGLTATGDPEHPFFELAQLSSLIDRIQEDTAPNQVDHDLSAIRTWMAENRACEGPLNVSCVFMVDADFRLRVSIQLKNVPSPYEGGLLRHRHVAEARFSSLVTLNPRDNRLPSVVIQPLICSDVLELDTSTQGVHPLSILTGGAGPLKQRPPDHIDVVSVAACTPQTKLQHRLRWKQEFLNSFVRSASNQDWRRHQYALFALSNYLTPPDDMEKAGIKPGHKASARTRARPGGLSGLFVPIALEPGPYKERVLIDMYARPNIKVRDETAWMTSEEFLLDSNAPDSPRMPPLLGSLIMLEPPGQEARRPSANLLTVVVDHLPRHANRWQRSGKVSGLKIYPIQVEK